MVHFGSFYSIYHAVDPWKGCRGSMVLNVKISMIDHFAKEGNIFYNTYKHCNYPKMTISLLSRLPLIYMYILIYYKIKIQYQKHKHHLIISRMVFFHFFSIQDESSGNII